MKTLLCAVSIFCHGIAIGQPTIKTEVSSANAAQFVKVSDGKFELDGAPFLFVGSNFYRLAMSEAFNGQVVKDSKSGITQYPQIDRVMQNYAADGFKVLRLWGFACEGSKGSNVQPPFINQDFSLNKEGLEQLDYTIASAGRHGLRIILPLVNFEHEYCGMEWWVEHSLAKKTDSSKKYLTWSCVESNTHHVLKLVYDPAECQSLSQSSQGIEAVVTKEFFYFDPLVKSAFKRHIENFLSRINPYTGSAYRDDPAIMAIELSNEPHTSDFYECLKTDIEHNTYGSCSAEDPRQYRAGTLVYNWLSEMSEFVKSIDSKHLLSTGEEGYRSSHEDSSCLSKHNWLHNGSKGIDFHENARLPKIDFMTTHLYPDNWNVPSSDMEWFNRCVISDRARIAAQHGKPIIMEETGFSEQGYDGKPDDYRKDRPYFLSRLYRYANQAGYQGTMVWQAAPLTLDDKVSEDDSFTFPIKQKKDDRWIYTAEAEAMLRQINCQSKLSTGGKTSECVSICPRLTPVNNEREGIDPQGYRCYLPEPSAAQTLEGYPQCPVTLAIQENWGWTQDPSLCQLYTIGATQYQQMGGCSCRL